MPGSNKVLKNRERAANRAAGNHTYPYLYHTIYQKNPYTHYHIKYIHTHILHTHVHHITYIHTYFAILTYVQALGTKMGNLRITRSLRKRRLNVPTAVCRFEPPSVMSRRPPMPLLNIQPKLFRSYSQELLFRRA